MAIETEGLNIPIAYSYDNAGLKKAQAELSKFTSTTSAGIVKSRNSFDNIKNIYNSVADGITKDNAKIVSSFNSYQNAINNVTKAEKNYKLASRNVGIARSNAMLKQMQANEFLAKITAKPPTDEAGRQAALVRGEQLALSKEKAVNQVDTAKESKAKALLSYKNAVNNASTALNGLISKQISVNDAIDKTNASVYEQSGSLNVLSSTSEKVKSKMAKLGDFLTSHSKKVDKASRSYSGFKFGRFLVYFNTLKAAVRSTNKVLEASSSWVENLNLLEVTFSGTQAEAKKFVDTVADNFGLDKNAIAQYVSTFKQMANAMGQASEVGTAMSEALTQVAIDIASLRNVSIDTAVSDLSGAIAGQVKPVRKYGFDITMYSIDELMEEEGFGAIGRQLSQADKQLARTILLIRQSRDAWGDLGKTINTYANQQKVADAQLKNLQRTLGNLLIGTVQVGKTFEDAKKTAGIATQALWYFNGAMMATVEILQLFIPEVAQFNMDGATNTVKQYADEMEEAEEATNGMLASFDKFDVLSEQSGGKGSSSASSMLNAKLIEEYNSYLEESKALYGDINQYAKEIKETILMWVFPSFDGGDFGEFIKQFGGDGNKIIGAMNQDLGELVKLMDNIVETIKNLKPVLDVILDILSFMSSAILQLSNNLGDKGITGVTYSLLGVVLLFKGLKLTASIGTLITKLASLTPAVKTFETSMVGLTGTMTKFQMATTLAAGAIGGIMLWQLIETITKGAPELRLMIGLAFALAGAFMAVALALKAITGGLAVALTAAALVGGIAAVTSSIVEMNKATSTPSHAAGGYQTGGLFFAGELGSEWVGRQGNTSTIVNDKQMSDIMMEAVANGVVVGNQAGGNTATNDKPINVYVGATKLFEITRDTARRQGIDFVKVR